MARSRSDVVVSEALPMIQLKAIKPSAKAIQFTRFADAAKLGMKDAADEVQKDIEATTKTWSHQPTITIKERQDGFVIEVQDDVWNMLDKGTRAHRIIARKAKRLRFVGGYRAKTRPGFIGSTSGGTSGGPVFRQSVMHPGTTARGWSKLIGAKYRAQLSKFISKRIKEAL
jgi:hypothetical protein